MNIPLLVTAIVPSDLFVTNQTAAECLLPEVSGRQRCELLCQDVISLVPVIMLLHEEEN